MGDLYRWLEPLKDIEGDVAYLYSDFRSLYKPGNHPNKRHFLQTIVNRLRENFSVIIAPSFTYTKQGVFDPDSSLTSLGALNRFLQTHEGSYTSSHPMFSFSALGDGAETILRDIGAEAFGSDSVFDRLLTENALFVHLGRPPRLGNTAMHFVEWQRQVPYRSQMRIPTRVIRSGATVASHFSAFLRRDEYYRDSTFASDFSATAEVLENTQRYEKIYGVDDFDSVWVGRYTDIVEGMRNVLDFNPLAFVRSVE